MTADEIREAFDVSSTDGLDPQVLKYFQINVLGEIAAQLAELNAHLASVTGYEAARPEIKGIRTRTEILK